MIVKWEWGFAGHWLECFIDEVLVLGDMFNVILDGDQLFYNRVSVAVHAPLILD